MSGPFVAGRNAQPLDLMLSQGLAGDGWEGLTNLEQMVPQTKGVLQPEDEVARFMWGLYNTVEGRRMFEWWMDVTMRIPLRITGKTIEETALLATARQALHGAGETVLAAIAAGKTSVEDGQRNQNGAGT